ncbi:hypothetical protein [Alysiella filiformis]|uniref:Uncharacterized protein n=1 Tax=Alysiella filiformis DSM 16848 TaxID=1120981 RepID=A0A286EA93_9NEIS|nr:hypothetical protein [Alysiella filiformis]QMT31347.1 hypothetical protein H3L97_00010 [Alysiella filiformis]UBQ55645.1 hypothetical protein JF568_08650 [Alysiella filiformis DSM 16848]SOD67754.1 hypothetical protein SAMN02746062_01021 [Alysiella filiformis DSM 16848]
MSKYYVYSPTNQVDHFIGTYELSELVKKFDIPHHSTKKANYSVHNTDIIKHCSNPVEDILYIYKDALNAAQCAGFHKSDTRDVHVFTIPNANSECELGFIFKENQNGITYIVSPYPLLHLQEFEIKDQ